MSPLLPDLFTSGCRLTGGQINPVTGLDSLERNYRFTFPHLQDMAPLTREPVRHRSTGWLTGSVGVGIGEHTPIRITTAGINGLLLYAPLTGRLQVRQDGTRHEAPSAQGWMLFNEWPAQAQTGANCGIIIAMKRARLQATFDTMMGAPSGDVCAHTQVLNLATPAGRSAQNDLPLLLHLSSEAAREWPEGVTHAEEAVYRFVARPIAPDLRDREARGPLRTARERHTVDLACGFMQSQIDRALTLTEVEALTGMGTRKLQGAFLRHLGRTPMAWLKEQRLLLAHHLIRTGGAGSVSTVATASGLNHFGRFARDFRQRFGVTPRDLAAESRRSDLH